MNDQKSEQNTSPKDKNLEVMDQLAKMQEIIDRQEKQIGMLTHVADKGRLARLRKPEDQPMRIKLSLFDDKVVTKWKLTHDYVKKGSKENVEKQIVEYTLEDDQVVEMSYVDSVIKTVKESVEVSEVSEKMVDGVKCKFFTVEYEGKTYKMDSKYVN